MNLITIQLGAYDTSVAGIQLSASERVKGHIPTLYPILIVRHTSIL